jgi:hypothetical protein
MKDKKALRLLATLIDSLDDSRKLAILRREHASVLVANASLRNRVYTASEEERLHGHNTGTGAEK